MKYFIVIKVFQFVNAKYKERYTNTVEIDDAVSFDYDGMTKSLRTLYPKCNISYSLNF